MSSNDFIILENISKTYNQKVVLNIDSFKLEFCGVVAIIGWSGAGKSTLLNILSLIDTPDLKYIDGDKEPSIKAYINKTHYEIEYSTKGVPSVYTLNDEKRTLVKTSEYKRAVFSYIFQDHYLHPNFNIYDNITTPMMISTDKIRKDSVNSLTEKVGIFSELAKFPNQVSGGQAQRGAIVRTVQSLLVMRLPVILISVNQD